MMLISKHSISVVVLLVLLPTALSRELNDKTNCLAAPSYICALRPTTSNIVRGTVIISTFFRGSRRRRKCLVRIQATVTNLTAGDHGFHVHTYGDVTSDTGSSAGGHFTNVRMEDIPHGYPDSRPRHWGDFGNLTANEEGVATYDAIDPVARYRSLLGRGIIVHELPDMGPMAQPSGGAGSRQASCVIGFANPDSLMV